MSAQMEKIFKKRSSVVTRTIADETILVPISGNIANMQHIFSLDSVGELIWENLDGQTALDQIVLKIVDDFEIDIDTATKDCIEFVNNLLESELVEQIP